jgi:4-hydroxybenzoate polyprenyltransferase
MRRLQAYAQLVRLPNLPSALADICLGLLVVWGSASALPPYWGARFVFLLLASACLYSAGMVLNDYFDVDQDRRERPQRPIPSGRVGRLEAAWLGGGLLLAGILSAVGASIVARNALPAVLAVLITGAVMLYDGVLKRTWAGPLAMGLCRFLNVLLGLSIAGEIEWQGMLLALVVGLYVVGVTWFARTEARTSNVRALQGAALVMLLGLVLAVPLPASLKHPYTSSMLFLYLLVALACAVGVPVVRALASPEPALVQAAVGRALLGLILLDAVLASGMAGTIGLLLLLLLVPAFGLRKVRWLYST